MVNSADLIYKDRNNAFVPLQEWIIMFILITANCLELTTEDEVAAV